MNIMNSLRRSLARAIGVAVIAGALAGCMGAGPFNGSQTNDGMEVLVVGTSDRAPVTPEQYMAIASIANYWKDMADVQISSVGEAAASGAAAYGTAYAAAGALQGLVYAGADAGAGAVIGGAQGIGGGAIYGYITHAQARSSIIGQGTIESINRLVAKGDPLLHNIVVVTSLVRTRNQTNKPADGVVPDWGGPRAGSVMVPNNSQPRQAAPSAPRQRAPQ